MVIMRAVKMKTQQQQPSVLTAQPGPNFGLFALDDFDSYQPCFFESGTEEGFYAPAPSEDIWKKFELLPTPPRSPRRDGEEVDDSGLDDIDGDMGGLFRPGSPVVDMMDTVSNATSVTTERLKLVSELLEDDPISQTVVLTDFFSTSPPSSICSQPNLKLNLIQDCMWSGNHGTDCEEHDKDEESEVESKPSNISTPDINATTDCVDPTAVFPYPISEQKNSFPDTPSASEDSDEDFMDEDDDDDEEEIDVVNIINVSNIEEKKPDLAPTPPRIIITQTKRVSRSEATSPVPQLVSTTPQKTLSSKGSTKFTIKTLKRKSVSLPSSPLPNKKSKKHLSANELRKAVQKLNHRSAISECHNYDRPCSDSDDCENMGPGKRTQHNVLERKRRNDLKSNFFSLRDAVPTIQKQERTPKVVILQKATDYVRKLIQESVRTERELRHEQSRQEQLLRKIAALEKLQRR